MEIEFVGATDTVTGSMHLVHTNGALILLDCGLFQGRRDEAREQNRRLPLPASRIDVAVLSHAHIDHSGALPCLFKNGFHGTVFTTPATRDLCAAMLEDAAEIQMHDARYLNKRIARGELDCDPVEPLYDRDDVACVLAHMVGVPYHRRLAIADGVTLTLHDAGHVLGSAIVQLDVAEPGGSRRLVFTGDLGRRRMPILRDPEIPDGADAVISESTYGNRHHEPIEEMDERLGTVIKRTIDRGGRVIIPSFALERAQEIIVAIKRLRVEGRIGAVPVYVDSPLTSELTNVFKMHPECYDAETRAAIRHHESPFDFDGLTFVNDLEDSKALIASGEPAVVIAASGMCEAGRVLHHLRGVIEAPKNTVCIVGFQAPHTLGRRLVEGRDRVRIFGVERDRRAEVVVLGGFSAHADQADLVDFAERLRENNGLAHYALVHGEPKARERLAALLRDRGFPGVATPRKGERLRV